MESIANTTQLSIEIIRNDGTREILGTVVLSKADNDNDSIDQFGKE
jgi:hypothetical protein